jgi:hypothetical protein
MPLAEAPEKAKGGEGSANYGDGRFSGLDYLTKPGAVLFRPLVGLPGNAIQENRSRRCWSWTPSNFIVSPAREAYDAQARVLDRNFWLIGASRNRTK